MQPSKRLTEWKLSFRIMTLLFLAFVIASCQKEGCIDSRADNYNSEADKDDGSCVYVEANKIPVISIEDPVMEVEIARDYALRSLLTDNRGLATATYTVSSDLFPEGIYYTIDLNLEGTSQDISLAPELPEWYMVGAHNLLVTCTDTDGNQATKEMEFTVVDSYGPVLDSASYSGDVELSKGVGLTWSGSDIGGLKAMEVEFWAHKYVGDDPVTGDPIGSDELEFIDEDLVEFDFPQFHEVKRYPQFDSDSVVSGDYELRWTLTDFTGNTTAGVLEGELLP